MAPLAHERRSGRLRHGWSHVFAALEWLVGGGCSQSSSLHDCTLILSIMVWGPHAGPHAVAVAGLLRLEGAETVNRYSVAGPPTVTCQSSYSSSPHGQGRHRCKLPSRRQGCGSYAVEALGPARLDGVGTAVLYSVVGHPPIPCEGVFRFVPALTIVASAWTSGC